MVTTIVTMGGTPVIESIGSTLTSAALSSLGLGGILITLGYSAGRKPRSM